MNWGHFLKNKDNYEQHTFLEGPKQLFRGVPTVTSFFFPGALYEHSVCHLDYEYFAYTLCCIHFDMFL